MFFDIKVLGSQEITIIKAFDMIEFYFKRRENMAYRCGERYQMGLLPQSIEEYVADNDPVRAYDALVDGQVACLWLFLRGKKFPVERECYHNIAFIWLMGGLKPDHKTIAEFRRRNKKALQEILRNCD